MTIIHICERLVESKLFYLVFLKSSRLFDVLALFQEWALLLYLKQFITNQVDLVVVVTA